VGDDARHYPPPRRRVRLARECWYRDAQGVEARVPAGTVCAVVYDGRAAGLSGIDVLLPGGRLMTLTPTEGQIEDMPDG